jgi:hypothetical protein
MSPNKLSLVLLIAAVVTASFGQTSAQVSDDDDFEQVTTRPAFLLESGSTLEVGRA